MMRKKYKLSLTFFFILSGMVSATRTMAQDSIVLKFNYPQKIHAIVKFNPIPILWGPLLYTGEYRLLSEFTTSKRQSTQIGVGHHGPQEPGFGVRWRGGGVATFTLSE